MEEWKDGWPSCAKASVGKKGGRMEDWKNGRVDGPPALKLRWVKRVEGWKEYV